MVGVIMMLDAVGSSAGKFGIAISVISGICWLAIAAWEFFLMGRLLLLFKSVGSSLNPAPAPQAIEGRRASEE
jgi:hypothetical protein